MTHPILLRYGVNLMWRSSLLCSVNHVSGFESQAARKYFTALSGIARNQIFWQPVDNVTYRDVCITFPSMIIIDHGAFLLKWEGMYMHVCTVLLTYIHLCYVLFIPSNAFWVLISIKYNSWSAWIECQNFLFSCWISSIKILCLQYVNCAILFTVP